MGNRRGNIEHPDRMEIFEHYQPLLLSIAYSILGVQAEAEELLQEARERWRQSTDFELATAKASLVMDIAIVSFERLQVMHQSGLQVMHQSKGPTRSCPFSALGGAPTRCSATASPPANSVSRLALMALDGLTPLERSAFLLRKIFKCHYSAIGRILDGDEAGCRKTVSKIEKSIARNRSTIDLLKPS